MKRHIDKHILMVDDDLNYIDLVNKALSTCQPQCHLKALSTGTELLAWLETSSRPNLIFLDIDMPDLSGFDILKKLKTQEKYKAIPVIILTVSDRQQDVMRSYDSGANGYIQKPEIFADLLTCMRSMTRYWFNFGSTPSHDWTNPTWLNLN